MKTEKEQGVLVVELSRADFADPLALNESFERLILQEGEKKILVDLSAIDYMTSLQLGIIVGLHIMAYENVAVLKFSGLTQKVKMLFRLLGIDTLVEMHYGKAQALESFEAPPGEKPRPFGDA